MTNSHSFNLEKETYAKVQQVTWIMVERVFKKMIHNSLYQASFKLRTSGLKRKTANNVQIKANYSKKKKKKTD